MLLVLCLQIFLIPQTIFLTTNIVTSDQPVAQSSFLQPGFNVTNLLLQEEGNTLCGLSPFDCTSNGLTTLFAEKLAKIFYFSVLTDLGQNITPPSSNILVVGIWGSGDSTKLEGCSQKCLVEALTID